ncbi:MAG: hypothetical protein FWG43_06130 [Clostridiales bacterium]|nr:hypothetical protein [Clostridiales bacterium]
MIEKSFRKLEFDKILDMLAAEAGFACSRELALGLRPATQAREAGERLAATEEAREIWRLHPGFSLGPLWDIRPQLRLVEIGGGPEAEAFL